MVESCRRKIRIGEEEYTYVDITMPEGAKEKVGRLPYSIRVLLEGVLRTMDGVNIRSEHAEALYAFPETLGGQGEVPFSPGRILLQDFTGVPCVVDLAGMRSAMKERGEDPDKINPSVPVDLVIDHSIQVDCSACPEALRINEELEYERNSERYRFLKWATKAFSSFRAVPPDTGIIHQVNLEYLAKSVLKKEEKGETLLYPDTVFGTDSHTTMIGGLGVLGWGVGGIEAEAGMLGEASWFVLPEVIGVRMTGRLPEGTTATDLALTVTELLRKEGVVSKFVEFFGEGASSLSLADRATISNMAPEYGATCGFFPPDDETISYLRLTGRSEKEVRIIETYLKENALFRKEGSEDPVYTKVLTLDLGSIQPSIAGPKRPQDRILLKDAGEAFRRALTAPAGNQGFGLTEAELQKEAKGEVRSGESFTLRTGSVVLAAITSCTNTSNPGVMIGAGLLARKARKAGLKAAPHVKTSLTPGSLVVEEYLRSSGLLEDLEHFGFHIAGYGCASCIGNSGPLDPSIEEAIRSEDLLTASVLSGNRNFEGRIHPLIKANYLMSPALVVAYAIFGRMDEDITTLPLGRNERGEDVFLRDLLPSNEEIQAVMREALTPEVFRAVYEDAEGRRERWNQLSSADGKLYSFEEESTYVRNPPFFDEGEGFVSIEGARALAFFGDSVTTDHISPAGNIAKTSPAARYLREHGTEDKDFNTYGSRRGNHEVMMRGTFANVRIRNRLVAPKEGGYTRDLRTGEVLSIFDAALHGQEDGISWMILAGKDYGMGSSRDWAAKGPKLLGVRMVLAESYERIHRSNLVMMGIVPLTYREGENAETYCLTGEESFTLQMDGKAPERESELLVRRPSGEEFRLPVLVRFDSPAELDYYRCGGILPMVLKKKQGEAE